ncbi:MAG: Tim44/TimA family putative adaptor protein [Ahrensia sp.]|nr:Tim44/TimA family putative adaptor protein [Ahrensia sp.]
MEFDLFTLLPLAVAVFVFWKLRSVLGTRNGTERPPYDPYVGSDDQAKPVETNDNVVTLPNARGRDNKVSAETDEERIAQIAGDNEALAKGLRAIAARDPAFDPDQFLDGGKMAYEMIVTGYADGDKRTLKGLLSREVYDNFAAAIDDRNSRYEKVNSSFVGIEKAEIVGAELVKEEAQITVRFVSQMISATLDKDDNIIDGDLQEVAEITDVWTFARPVKSRDPNWSLVATDA